ncbi:MAG TPA: DUF4157 domain-containing protein [Kofleriaceae bacterium]|nr:DUF4157 domain-containing protein [Kofleriaceae bacterium]
MAIGLDRLINGEVGDEEVARRAIAPGRVPATINLAPRPLTNIVFRYADRDDNGVAAGADVAVAHAAGSSGSPLPADVRARFEQSLGADLSGVRVHTGDASATAAHAVGAHAYTIGQDIHFAGGAFSISDPFGLHLLAHEVAHTVQQSGGVASQRQHKLEVSTRGDALEIEAERAADAMVSGARAAVSGGPTIAARGPGDPPPAAGGATAKKSVRETVELVDFNFSKDGAVTSKPDAKGIAIDAPDIKLVANVKIKDSITGDDLKAVEEIKVGSVQNLTSSDRTGVYKKPDGSVAVEYRGSAGAMADAQWQDGKSATGPKDRDKGAVAPFYQTPDTLGPNKVTAQAKMDDKPGFQLPMQMSGGTLTEIKGQDSFVTSAAAKRDGDLVHLQQEQWSVPWAMQIDASKTGAGKPVDATPTTATPDKNDGDIAINSPDWFKFKTVEDAKAAPINTLLSALAVSRSKDPDNYQICLQAVQQLNWRFTVTVRCNEKYSLIMKDNVKLSCKGAQGSFDSTFELGKGDSGTATFQFGTIFDAAQWVDGNKITFVVTAEGHTFSETQGCPWTGTEGTVPMGDSKGKYNIGVVRS